MYTLINAIRKYLHVQPVIAGRDVDIGIENRYTVDETNQLLSAHGEDTLR